MGLFVRLSTGVSCTRNQAKGVDIAEMQARVDRYLKTAEWKKGEAQGWGVNRALVGEVFTQNQFYIRRFQDKASKQLGKLYYNDWGLESFGKRLARASEPMPQYEGEAQAWYESHRVLEDYEGRKITIDEKVFTFHTTGSHSMRVSLLEAVPQVLKKTDEVWINDYASKKFDRVHFIKFYKDTVFDVVCEVTDNLEYRIATWFEIIKNPKLKKKPSPSERYKDPRWRYRRGLLIKKS